MKSKKFISTTEAARILGISRVSVFNKIKKGEIPAVMIGKSFVIDRADVQKMTDQTLERSTKKQIDNAVKKTIKDYGQTLKMLGKE